MKHIGKYYIQLPLPNNGFVCMSYSKNNKLLSWDYYKGSGTSISLMIAKISLTIYWRGLN